MGNSTIDNLPSAVAIGQASDYIEIAHYVGGTSYVSQRATPLQILSGSSAAPLVADVFTLTANTTVTYVPVTGCKPTSKLAGIPWPQTLHAANAIDTTFYSMGTNQIVVNHANNPLTDRTFGFVLLF